MPHGHHGENIDDGSLIDIELQLLNNAQYAIRKRTTYYFSKMYAGTLTEGKNYEDLRPCIMVNIINFNLDEDEDFLSRYQIRKYVHDRILNEDMDFFFIELPKWQAWSNKQGKVNIKEVNRLCRWLTYLTGSDPELLNELKEQDPLIREAVMIERNYTMDDEKWYEYLMREKALRDQSALESHYKNEYEKGMKKSREEGIEIGEKRQLLVSIRGLIENGLSAEIIKKALRCSDADIKEAIAAK